MVIDSSITLVDNDFIIKLLDAKLRERDLNSVLNLAFSELQITGCVHSLVRKNEMIYKARQIRKLFDDNVLHELALTDIFQESQDRKAYYALLVEELFEIINDEPIPEDVEDVLDFWKSDLNLGEVHAMAACTVCRCAMFLSDDWGSKRLAKFIEQKFNFIIKVYNRKEFFEKHMLEGTTQFNQRERRALTHAL